jgi:UDP-N-acetylmuramyl pentapeptide phosphotransferase/UDP-N-acetylglucosamine-1-phosphate transferase
VGVAYYDNVLKNCDSMIITDFKQLHDEKTETGTPRVGGTIIWISVLVVILGMFIMSKFIGGTVFEKLDFLSRGQTLLPLGALFFGGMFGLFEDMLEIFTDRFKMFSQGLSSKYLVTIVSLMLGTESPSSCSETGEPTP